MAKEIPIPEELSVLLPETNKKVVVIGDKAYEIFPLWEGQLEKISKDIANYFDSIFSDDRRCPKCGKVVKNAIAKKIEECPVDKEALEDMRKSPIEAILGGGKVPDWIEMVLGIPKEEIREKITFPQLKHLAAVFYQQNFSTDGLPQESRENFQKLLGMIGLGKATPAANQEETK